MLSKVLTGAAGSAAAHLTWPSAGGGCRASASALLQAGGRRPARSRRRMPAASPNWNSRWNGARGSPVKPAAAKAKPPAVRRPPRHWQPVLDKTGARHPGDRRCCAHKSRGKLPSDWWVSPWALRAASCTANCRWTLAALEGLVRVALQKLGGQEICRVRVHPELETGVRQALAREGRGGLAPGRRRNPGARRHSDRHGPRQAGCLP